MPAEAVLGLPTGIETHEQFSNPAQQKHAAELGMWAWLLTELLLFGGLFLIALVLRYEYPDSVHAATMHFKFWIGAANTTILICSSLTMSGAIMLSRLGGQRLMIYCMLATVALGTLFMGLKCYEWYLDWAEHMAPFLLDRPYELAGDAQSRLFVNLYFVATALHGFHLTTGVGLLSGLTWYARRPGFLSRHQNWIEIFGLYWHFIDLMWIMVYTVIYVVGR